MPIEGYYTTKEAADKLGLAHATIQDAVRRGAIQVERLSARQNLIPEDEIERYAANHRGGKGWEARKAPDYMPDTARAAYQRAWRARKREQQQPQEKQRPADVPAKEDA